MAKKFVISSGHGKLVRGASGILDEVNEARRVVEQVYHILTTEYNGAGYKFHDNTSRTQAQNLNTIVAFHNRRDRALDISVHFNAASATATGSECLYYDAKGLSAKMSKAMAHAMGIVDRGPKERKELAFLRGTNKPAILLEVCFVTSAKDAKAYRTNFDALCEAIAKVIANELGYTKRKSDITTVSKTSKPKAKAEYFTTSPGKVRIKKATWAYNGVELDEKKRETKVNKGDVFTVVDVAKTKAGTPRLKLKSGLYLTANKDYVEKA